MANNWKLVPKIKGKRLGSTANKNLQELSNYYPNKTKEDIENDFIETAEDLSVIANKWEDFDIEKAFLKTLSLSKRKREYLFEQVFKKWRKYSLKQLAIKVGRAKLYRIMTYVKNTYPDDYNNRVLKRWPALDNYI